MPNFDLEAPELPTEEIFKTYTSYLTENELSLFYKVRDEYLESSEK